MLRNLAAKYPDFPPLLGESLNTLGALKVSAGKLDEGGENLKEAQKVEEPLAEKNVTQFGGMLQDIYHNLSAYYHLKGNDVQAEAFSYDAVAISKRMAASDANFRPIVLKSLFNLSVFYRIEQKWLKAVETSQDGVAIGRALPKTSLNQLLLAEQLANLAAAEIGRGNNEQARSVLTDALNEYRQAADDPGLVDKVSASISVMNTALQDKAIRCEFLQKAEEVLAEHTVTSPIRSAVIACK